MNIYQKMNAITEEIKRIPKSLTIGFGKYQYKAVAEADILAAVKDAENRHGICSFPATRRMVESRSIPKGDEGKESQFVRFETTYRFINIDDPAEIVEVMSYGDGIDSQDKAPGKAMTYADKYALMKAYKIETGDDQLDTAKNSPDGHSIFMVKRRIEEKLTLCQQKSIEVKDILAHVGQNGSNEKQLKNALGYMDWVNALEKELDKRL